MAELSRWVRRSVDASYLHEFLSHVACSQVPCAFAKTEQVLLGLEHFSNLFVEVDILVCECHVDTFG